MTGTAWLVFDMAPLPALLLGAILGGTSSAVVIPLVLVPERLLCRAPDYSLRDAALTTVMVPKGLAAAVLAALPLQYGVARGELIQDATYVAVLLSTALTALLVAALPWGPVQRLCARALGRPMPRPSGRPAPQDQPDQPTEETPR